MIEKKLLITDFAFLHISPAYEAGRTIALLALLSAIAILKSISIISE